MVLCWVPVFISSDLQPPADLAPSSYLGGYLAAFNQDHPFITAVFAIWVIIANGFLMLQLNSAHIFIATRTQMPALLYMLLCSVFAGHAILIPALIASFLILLMLFRVFAAYKMETLSYNLMDAGILVSVASLFYFPAVLFYPVLLIVLSIIRPYIWREWVFTLIGLVLPYLFILAFFYLADLDIKELGNGMQRMFLSGQVFEMNRYSLGFLAYVCFLLLLGSFYMIRAIGNIKIHARKFFISFLWIFIGSLMIFFLVPGAGIEMMCFAALPISFLIGYYFAHCRPNRINNLFLWLFLAGITAVKVFG